MLRHRRIPRAAPDLAPSGRQLGLYGFGASAHVVLQVAVAQGATVHVLTRSVRARQLALSLGASWAGDAADESPEPLDAAILFAPVGTLVPVAMRALDRGGVLAVAGIHLTDVPSLVYERELFYEKEIRSVTANTRKDGEEFLRLAENLAIQSHVVTRSLGEAQQALLDLSNDAYEGAAVLLP